MMLIPILNILAIGIVIMMIWRGRSEQAIVMQAAPLKYHSLALPQSFLDRMYERYILQAFLPVKITERQMKYTLAGLVLLSIVFWLLVPIQAAIKIGILLSGIFIIMTVFEMRLEYIERHIDQSLFSFLSKLNARLIQNQDLMQVFQMVESDLDNRYIVEGIRQFNRSIRAGLSPEIAFDVLKNSVYHEYLHYIYLNVEQAYLKRGDVAVLMRALENEYTEIQIELNKRKIELQSERNFVFISVIFVILTAFAIARTNDFILIYYRSGQGQALMTWLITGGFAGLSLLLYVSKIKP